jgi:hypothetical protein
VQQAVQLQASIVVDALSASAAFSAESLLIERGFWGLLASGACMKSPLFKENVGTMPRAKCQAVQPCKVVVEMAHFVDCRIQAESHFSFSATQRGTRSARFSSSLLSAVATT